MLVIDILVRQRENKTTDTRQLVTPPHIITCCALPLPRARSLPSGPAACALLLAVTIAI